MSTAIEVHSGISNKLTNYIMHIDVNLTAMNEEYQVLEDTGFVLLYRYKKRGPRI